jgi:hypothetical protein
VSPVSRRRTSRNNHRANPAADGLDPVRIRRDPPLDVLGTELVALRGVDDALVVEARITRLVDLLDPRGAERDPGFAEFCRAAVDDPRSGTTTLGLQAMALLECLGHESVRSDAATRVAHASGELRAGVPPWAAALGRVRVVEAGSLRTADGTETVLHVMLDYDDPAHGSRHLLTIAAEHTEERVHLLDVRMRDAGDSLRPMAEVYAASQDPLWAWHETDDLDALVGDAVRSTSRHEAEVWQVLDLEGAPSRLWPLGVRRLAH